MFAYRINDKIMLYQVTLADAPQLFDLFNRNRTHLNEWQDWPNKIQTREDCTAYVIALDEEHKAGRTLANVIVVQDIIVGMCNLTKIVSLLRKAELEYWIDEGYQGQGIVTQSCKGLMVHAFDTMKLNRLALKFKHVTDDHENVRSRRVAERLGFVQEGILRQDGMTKGVMMDMVMYSMLAEEWRAQ